MTAVALGLAAIRASPAAAASSTIECGQSTGYTTPDPSAPAEGSRQLGFLTGGRYLGERRLRFGCRLLHLRPPPYRADVPHELPGGHRIDGHLHGDATTGQFIGFDGRAAFCGQGGITPGGDGQVGAAILPASVLDACDLAAPRAAKRKQTCTSVHATRTIDPTNGNIQIATDVDIVVATPGATVTAPRTSTISADLPVSGPGAPAVVWLALALCAAFVVTTRRFRSGQR